MKKVTIIIPCYNHGEFIDDAIRSVLSQTYQNIEIIIINDGSTDFYTNSILANYTHPKIKIINTENKGLPNARNTGIEVANGEFILPLDADDKIHADYIEEAMQIFNQNQRIRIVYCMAEKFGELNEKWNLPAYSYKKIILQNQIFCSALFRKKDWEVAGRYNPAMIYGFEDWDFWLKIIELGAETYRIPRTLFFYRTHKKSMILSMSIKNEFLSRLWIYKNHINLYPTFRCKIKYFIFSFYFIFMHHSILRIGK